MEFKVRRESQTLMEKVFTRYAGRRGKVSTSQIQNMMKEVNPELVLTQEELDNVIGGVDRQGTGILDLEGFNKVAVHFLIKQARHDQDQFIHKHEIGVQDFPDSSI